MQEIIKGNRESEFREIFKLYPTGAAWKYAERVDTDLNKLLPELLSPSLVLHASDDSRKIVWKTYKGEGQDTIDETLSLMDAEDRALFSVTHTIGPAHRKVTEWTFSGSLLPAKENKIVAEPTVRNFLNQVNQQGVFSCFQNPDIVSAPIVSAVKIRPKTIFERQGVLYNARREITPEYSEDIIMRDPEVLQLIMTQSDLRKQYGTTLFNVFNEATDAYKERFLTLLNGVAEIPNAFSEIFLYAGGWQHNMYNKDRDCRDLVMYARIDSAFLERVTSALPINEELTHKIYTTAETFFEMAVLANSTSKQLFDGYMSLYKEQSKNEPFDLSGKLGKVFKKIIEFDGNQCRTIMDLLEYIDETVLSHAMSALFSGNISGLYQLQPLSQEIIKRQGQGDTRLFDAADSLCRHHIATAAALS